MNAEGTLLVTRDGPVHTLTINNPGKRNALTPDCYLKMAETLTELAKESANRVVVLTGQGHNAFSAGNDIKSLPGKKPGAKSNSFKEIGLAIKAIRDFPNPIMAMLNGDALGAGCLLAIYCDIRIAAGHIRMGMPTPKMGLVPGAEAFNRFIKVLGYNYTLELFLTGRFYDSRTCLQMGLVNHIVERDELKSFTYEMARELAANAPLALRHSKFMINKIAEAAPIDLESQALFQKLVNEAAQSDDHEEAKQAFKEKRKPRFIGQ